MTKGFFETLFDRTEEDVRSLTGLTKADAEALFHKYCGPNTKIPTM